MWWKKVQKFVKVLSDQTIHVVLFLGGAFLSVGLFVLFGNDTVSRWLMGSIAVSIEWSKLTDLYKWNEFRVIYSSSKIEEDRRCAQKAKIRYLLKAFLSIVASVGFALCQLSAQANTQAAIEAATSSEMDLTIENYNEQLAEQDLLLEELKSTNKGVIEQMARNGQGYGEASKKFTSQSLSVAEVMQGIIEKKEEIRAKKLAYKLSLKDSQMNMTKERVQGNDMFEELTKFWNSIPLLWDVSVVSLKTFLFLLIMIVWEWSIASTAPVYSPKDAEETVKKTEEINREKLLNQERKKLIQELKKPKAANAETIQKFLMFVNNMYMPDGKRLYRYTTVAHHTDLSEEEAKKICETLESMVFNDKPIRKADKGCSRPGDSKERTLKIVEHLLKKPYDSLKIPDLSSVA